VICIVISRPVRQAAWGNSMAGVPAAAAFGHAVGSNVHYGKAQSS
jgi:hypothetical protein